MTPEQFTAIIETAHANDMEVFAHVNYAGHLAELVELGIDEAAHTPSDEMGGEPIVCCLFRFCVVYSGTLDENTLLF